jgi:hypothetical protein
LLERDGLRAKMDGLQPCVGEDHDMSWHRRGQSEIIGRRIPSTTTLIWSRLATASITADGSGGTGLPGQ